MKKTFSIFVFILLLTTNIAIAQESELPDPGILPDSPLYGLKIVAEAVGTFFTFGQEKKADRMLQLAEKRLAEAEVVAEKGNIKAVERAIKGYQKAIENALAHAQNAERKADVLEKVALATSKHLSVLDNVIDKVPEQAKEAIMKAKEVSMNGQKNALRALSEDKPEKAAEININAAKDRLKRAKEKADKGESEDVEEAVEEYEEITDFGNEISQIAQGLGKDTTTIDQLVARATTNHLDVLAEIYEKVPEQTKAAIESAMEKSVKVRETAVASLKEKNALGNISEEVPESVSKKIPEDVKVKIGIKSKPETVGKPEEVASPETIPKVVTEAPAKKTSEAVTKEVASPETIPKVVTEAPTGTGTLLMQITDAPPELNITKALVTISDVEVHLAGADEEENETTEAGWFTVVEEAETFDLIAIENIEEFLGTAELSAGKYTQIRLNINEALVTINGTEYDLTIPSKTVKLVKAFNIEPNETTTLTLDFDAQESIRSAGVDKYIMRPTIKVIQE